MIRHNSENVLAAFDMLLEEIEGVLHDINQAGADSFGAQDYETAHRALEYARSVMVLRERVSLLKRDWQALNTAFHASTPEGTAKAAIVTPPIRSKHSPSSKHSVSAPPEIPAPVDRLIVGRIRKGLRTPEPAFFPPILQALVELGGAAKRQEVFDIVAPLMEGVLKPIDFQPLASEARQLRWQNSAQWAHNLMVKEGLLMKDSPNGIWEITQKGRTFLFEENRKDR
jgi:restriction system protein